MAESSPTRQLFRKLLALWRSMYSTKPPTPNCLANSPFRLLPPELLLVIAEFLSVPSAAAFALCCQPMRGILGRSSWDALQNRTAQAKINREAFLSLLEKDMPFHIACQACRKLHRVKKPIFGDYYAPDLACWKKDTTTSANSVIFPTFHYAIFQMVMKRHRLGLDYNTLLKQLRYSEVEPGIEHMYQCKAEARIVSNSLYIRVQHGFLLSLSDDAPFPNRDMDRVCPHQGSNHIRFCSPGRLACIVRCRISHWKKREDKSCPICSGLHSCDSCPTEFQVDIKDFGEDGVVLAVTKWKTLGEGLNYSDPVWRSHFPREVTLPRHMAFEPGSILNAFEGGQPFRFDSLLPTVRVGQSL